MKKATKQKTLVKKLTKVSPAPKAKAKAKPAKKTKTPPVIPDIPDYDAWLASEKKLVDHWGCEPEEAQAAVNSQRHAWLQEKIWPIRGGDSLTCAADTERALIYMYGHRPTELLKVLLSCPELAERMDADPAGFAFRLHNFHETKKGGIRQLDDYPLWKNIILGGWTNFTKWPPLCLWTDGALATTFDEMPAEETVRQFISRAGLLRPKSPRFGVEELRIHGQPAVCFVKRTGGTFGKKNLR